MRQTILISIVVSQIGFASAYVVFTGENLKAFIRTPPSSSSSPQTPTNPSQSP